MRKFYVILAIVLLSATIWAQSPQKMSYQAIIRNASDQLVTTQIGMQISIIQGTVDGTVVYSEIQTPTPNINGLVTIEIGGGNPGTFAAIDWSDGPYFIKTETDPAGGTSYTITGTSQLLSVPYALYAKTAGGHYAGELYGGGIVVAVWKVSGVEHGLIASLTDISTSAAWSNVTETLIGETAQSPIDGQSNTNAIIAQSGHISSSAKLCDDYTSDGFNDWYLPSASELRQIYHSAFVMNTILGKTNGLHVAFSLGAYWSSTEGDYNKAWVHNCAVGAGLASPNPKAGLYRVRAVRRF